MSMFKEDIKKKFIMGFRDVIRGGWVESGGKIGDWGICPNLSPKEIDFVHA